MSAPPATSEPADRLAALRERDARRVQHLRLHAIPQRIGMAAAARLLAEDIAALTRERLETLAVAPDGNDRAALLREEGARVIVHVRARGEAWLNEALRMDGEAAALAARLSQGDELEVGEE